MLAMLWPVLALAAAAQVQAFLPYPAVPFAKSVRGGPKNQRRWQSSGGGVLRNKLIEVPEERLAEVFNFLDTEAGATVECYAESFAEIEGKKYCVGYPVDDAVAIAMEQDGEIMPVPVDDELMDTLYPILKKDLEEAGSGLVLKRTPVTLTLSGLEAYDSVDRENIVGDDDEDDLEDDGENEDVELISELDVNGEKFLLVKFLDPVLMVAREVEPKGGKGAPQYELLPPDEDERVSMLVEDLLAQDPDE